MITPTVEKSFTLRQRDFKMYWNQLFVLAQESEHPRAIEVAANTANTLSDIAQKLMDHQLRTEKLNNPQGTNNNVTNNNLNVKLSTKDLLEMIKNDE